MNMRMLHRINSIIYMVAFILMLINGVLDFASLGSLGCVSGILSYISSACFLAVSILQWEKSNTVNTF